jgi:hypothetical protein
MDAVTIGAVLAAVAGGAGGALGAQVWAGVSALVRRPFRQSHHDRDAPAVVPSGTAELALLAENPADQQRAVTLAEVLIARADTDSGFRQALAAWWDQASHVQISGNVSSTISGGTFFGPVVQGRDFTGLTFGSPAPPSGPSPDEGTK